MCRRLSFLQTPTCRRVPFVLRYHSTTLTPRPLPTSTLHASALEGQTAALCLLRSALGPPTHPHSQQLCGRAAPAHLRERASTGLHLITLATGATPMATPVTPRVSGRSPSPPSARNPITVSKVQSCESSSAALQRAGTRWVLGRSPARPPVRGGGAAGGREVGSLQAVTGLRSEFSPQPESQLNLSGHFRIVFFGKMQRLEVANTSQLRFSVSSPCSQFPAHPGEVRLFAPTPTRMSAAGGNGYDLTLAGAGIYI